MQLLEVQIRSQIMLISLIQTFSFHPLQEVLILWIFSKTLFENIQDTLKLIVTHIHTKQIVVLFYIYM